MDYCDDVLFAPIGTKMKFLNKCGLQGDREYALKIGLEEGKEYTLSYIDVHSSMSYVYLEEFPRNGFNSVMFSCEYDEPYDEWMKDYL